MRLHERLTEQIGKVVLDHGQTLCIDLLAARFRSNGGCAGCVRAGWFGFLAAISVILASTFTTALQAQPQVTQSSSSGLHPAGTNVVATYDGGKITSAEVAERAIEPHFVVDAEQKATPNVLVSQEEKLARHLAALRILVNESRSRGFDRPADPDVAKREPQPQHHPFASVGDGWKLEKKLIEQRVLAQALSDELRRSAIISEQEFEDQYRTNRFNLLGFESVEAGRIGISARKHGNDALKRAGEALALIRGGESFATVASRYSDLEINLARPGNYGARFWGNDIGLLLGEFGEGKVSGPLPVADGYELVKVERIYLGGNLTSEGAKAKLRILLNQMAAQDRVDQMTKAAEATFPVIMVPSNPSPATFNLQPSNNHVLLQCGQFRLTGEDLRGLAVQRGDASIENQKMIETLKRESGYHLQMGEMARSLGYDKRPDVQRALQYELDKQLAEKARQVLLPELAAEMTFPEDQIREAYETNFTATFPPQLHYDALVVPMRFPPNVTDAQRETVRTNALAKAEEIIQRVQNGAKLEEIASGDAIFQWMPGQSRVLNENSVLASLLTGLKPDQIAAQPYEDFGGYCIIRVGKAEPRRKMPYELARNYLIHDFRNAAVRDLHNHFETALLNKHHFAFGPTVAGRIRDAAPAAVTNLKTQK